MSTKYSPQSFFRHVPNAMLFDYFKMRGVLQKHDFSKVTENKIEQIYDAWKQLPEELRSEMEGDFQTITALANEGGIKAIIDEALWHGEDLAPVLEHINGFYEKVFWVFLKRNQYIKGGTLFAYADKINQTRWREWRIEKNIAALVNENSIDVLAQNLSTYFYQKQGRGRHCKVDVYRRSNLDYFFAFPEDYSLVGLEWQSESLEQTTRRPFFEVIFVYSQDEQKISLYMKGSATEKSEVRRLFASAVLALDVNEFTEEKRVYDLKPFEIKQPHFQVTPETGIENIAVNKLRLRFKDTGDRITIEAATYKNPMAAYDLKDKICQLIPSSQIEVDQVGIVATFIPEAEGKKAITRAFEINPNSCTLNHEGRGALLRQILKTSGLEPQVVQVKPKNLKK